MLLALIDGLFAFIFTSGTSVSALLAQAGTSKLSDITQAAWALAFLGGFLSFMKVIHSRYAQSPSASNSQGSNTQGGFAMIRFLIFLFAFSILGVKAAFAIDAPKVTQPINGILVFNWTTPTTRTSGVPLLVSELKEYRLYISYEANYISILSPSNSLTYVVPVGYTTTVADYAAITAVDTAGLQSEASPVVNLPPGVTTQKSPPSSPTNLKVK